MRPSAYTDRTVPAPADPNSPSRDRVTEDTLIARAWQQRQRKEIVPRAEAAHVIVRLRTVVELQQRRGSAPHHGRNELQRERIAECADGAPELPCRAASHLTQRQMLARPNRPAVAIDVGGKGICREAAVLRHPTRARAVRDRDEAAHRGDVMRGELPERVVRPAHHLAHDADDQCRRRRHERGIRCEVRRDFDAIAPRPHAHAGGAAVCGQEHHRRGEDVRQQIGKLLARAATCALAEGHVEGHVVMCAESDEAHGALVLHLPRIELAAEKSKAFPQGASRPRSAPSRDFDHRRGDLHHARVEVQRTTGGQMIGSSRPMHERSAHDASGRSEHVLRLLWNAVHHCRELRLKADRRKPSARDRSLAARSTIRATRLFHLVNGHYMPPASARRRLERSGATLTTDLQPTSGCTSLLPPRAVRSPRNRGRGADGHP